MRSGKDHVGRSGTIEDPRRPIISIHAQAIIGAWINTTKHRGQVIIGTRVVQDGLGDAVPFMVLST